MGGGGGRGVKVGGTLTLPLTASKFASIPRGRSIDATLIMANSVVSYSCLVSALHACLAQVYFMVVAVCS